MIVQLYILPISFIFFDRADITLRCASSFCTFNICFYCYQTDSYPVTLINENGIVLDSSYAVLIFY